MAQRGQGTVTAPMCRWPLLQPNVYSEERMRSRASCASSLARTDSTEEFWRRNAKLGEVEEAIRAADERDGDEVDGE